MAYTARQRRQGVVLIVDGPTTTNTVDKVSFVRGTDGLPHQHLSGRSATSNVIDFASFAQSAPASVRERQHKPSPDETWHMLGYIKDRGEQVVFRIDLGWTLPGMTNQNGVPVIESILPAPIHLQVAIEKISTEPENPEGIALLCRVANIQNHAAYLPSGPERMDMPAIKEGNLLQVSYSLTCASGGLCQVDEQDPHNNRPPLVNSLSDPVRIFDPQAGD